MAISMTEAAARHIRRSLDGRGKGEGIRLGVRTTGCSGLAYVLEFVRGLTREHELGLAATGRSEAVTGVVSVATTGVSARTAVPVYAPSSVANELPVVNSDTTP